MKIPTFELSNKKCSGYRRARFLRDSKNGRGRNAALYEKMRMNAIEGRGDIL
jgi:hypothetical protein